MFALTKLAAATSELKPPKITFWRVVVTAILAAGFYATVVRFAQGLDASTNLSDPVPWGLWVGLNTLCGVGLSAGGFAIAAAVYILGLERYRPVLRAAILVSFLGYLSVVAGMFFELGLPWRIWHPIVMWNRASVLFEVAWCVMLYTTVLALEFSPALFEKAPWKPVREFYLHWHKRLLIGLVLVGVILSSLHQSFLGGLFLITKGKLYALWYSPQLPALFFLSAIPAGLALVIMALYLSVRSLGVRIDRRILHDTSRVIVLLLAAYAIFRGLDLLTRGGWNWLWVPREETWLFWVEITLFLIVPLVMFTARRARWDPQWLYWGSASVVMGFMANRINVSITGLQASSGTYYYPSWMETASALAIFTAAVVAFRLAVLHLKIFPRAAIERPEPLPWPAAPPAEVPAE